MPELYIGLMSGTSMDAVDAVLCEFDQGRFMRASARETQSYPPTLRERLLQLQRETPAITLGEFSALDNEVARIFASTANALMHQCGLAATRIHALGSHGQTVFHDPARVGSSLQLGNPNLIAALTGITTVADFRRADIARGGQGAPLVPAFHQAVFATDIEARCVVNIGGIANISLLQTAQAGPVLGFDTGPGNGLMDEWIELQRQRPYDAGGTWARSGTLDPALLAALLDDRYFHLPAPKSTGRHRFNLDWARERYPALMTLPPANVQRSFCELTARSIAQAIASTMKDCRRVLVCGGGIGNHLLIERLRDLLGHTQIQTTDEYGLAATDVEAAAFAWLAMRTLNRLPGNLPDVTGAATSAILGGIYHA